MASVTTNVAVNNVAKETLAASNPVRRGLVVYNPGAIALDVFVGSSAVAMVRLFQYGVLILNPGDDTGIIEGQLVSAGPQDIAVTVRT